MTKKIKILYCITILLLCLSSCGKDENSYLNSYGYVKLSFKEDKEDIIVGRTKTIEPIFSVNIFNSAGVILQSYADHRELEKEPLKLKTGTYYIEAYTGDNVEYGFEKPFYKGRDTISVATGNIENSTVVCKLANVKVSIEIDKSLNEQFKEYLVTVTNSNNNSGLIFSSAANTIGNAGYFNCTGTLNWSLYLVNNNNVAFDGDVKGTLNNVQPREHYILRFKVSENGDGGASNVTIVVDDSVNEKEQNFVINLNKKAKPKYTGVGFNLENNQLISEQTQLPWQVNVESKEGATQMVISHNSLAFANAGIPYSFDIFNITPDKKALINSAGLKWSDLTAESVNIMLDFSVLISNLPLGDYKIDFSTLDKQNQKGDASFKFNVIPSVEVTSLSVDPWAKHAFFYGVWNTIEKPAGLGMEYKKVSDTQWTKITDGFTIEKKEYSIKVSNLEPSTAYVMRTLSAKEASNEIAFTTEDAMQIPNMGFDKWYKDGKHWYANENSSNFWWDSGNRGANTLSEVNPTAPSSDVAVSGEGKQAVRMESKTVFTILAAGNIYLGQFGKTIGTSGAEIYFGRPYKSRPLSLKGYYNYIPKPIDKTKSPYDGLKGQSDLCQIYVLLADWGNWFTVNTSEKKFIDIANDPAIIAYGEMTKNENSNGYQQFEIPLIYRNKRTPTHCIIVASASKYGDFFTGGVGSVLYIDEFEFTF